MVGILSDLSHQKIRMIFVKMLLAAVANSWMKCGLEKIDGKTIFVL